MILCTSKIFRFLLVMLTSSSKTLCFFQESDILESPGVYYRSSLVDKVSDYEDIWGPESNNCSTFKPMKTENDNNISNGFMKSKRPDLLPDTLRKPNKLQFLISNEKVLF